MSNDFIRGIIPDYSKFFRKGASESSPYIQRAKKSLSAYLAMPWLQGWQWAIEIKAAGAPQDFDIYVKDVSFGAGSIDADVKVVGSGGFALPTTASVGEITMTVRDSEKLTVNQWIDERLALVKNEDGTINIPKDYLFEMRLFMLTSEGEKLPYKSYQVYPTKRGDVTWSREEVNTVASFPLVFQKFSTVGKKVF